MASVATNFRAFDALVQFNRVDEGINKSLSKLSSGVRLEKSADDVVDFNTSDNIRAEIRELRSLRRANFDGTSVIQLADGTLQEATNILTRIIELGMRSATGTLGADNSFSKQANDAEYQDLLAELDQLNERANFNDLQLFGTGLSYPVNLEPALAAGGSDQVTITTTPFDTTTLGLAGTDLLTTANGDVVLAAAEAAIDNLSRQRGQLGAIQKRLIDNMDTLDIRVANLQEQESRLRDTDIATETVQLTRLQLQSQSNVSVMAQANLTSEAVFQLLS
ncbi:MAG: flagellin [Acidobacteriota bacterium]|nr:flagellin [Acidobacteriota bacterium]